MPTLTKYPYTISTDFSGGVNSTRLKDIDIANSTISIALDHIDTAGDVCDIWFKDVLSTDDAASLDTVVAEHDGTPTPAVSYPAPLYSTCPRLHANGTSGRQEATASCPYRH